jgi:hypothetical protein
LNPTRIFITNLTFASGKECPLTGEFFPIWIPHFSVNSEADVAQLHRNFPFAVPAQVVRGRADFRTFFLQRFLRWEHWRL